MMKKVTLVLLSMMMFVGLATAQNVNVSGTVVSAEDGESVIGASVLVKGKTIGTVTDFDGNFTLSVPSGSKTLVVSYIGMKTQDVAVKSNVKVVLKSDSELLDEVVVVAYGTTTKGAFTGSAGVVNTEDLKKRQVSNVTQALSGTVAGVQVQSANGQPGESATVRIRGIGSINAGSNPLYIVDGSPFDGDINSINSQDVESMTVLKDAASTAMYGARGANGIILITTKKGRTGKAKINLDAKYGVNSRAITNYDVITSTAQYLETLYQSNYSAGQGLGKKGDELIAYANGLLTGENENGGTGYQIYTLPKGQMLIGADGKLNPAAKMGYSDGDYYYTADNWADEIFTNKARQEYNLSISGGDDKLNYYLSAGHLSDKGIIDGSGFKRLSTRLKADYQAKEWLKVGANLSYTNSHTNFSNENIATASSGNAFRMANFIAPVYPLYVRNADGTIKTEQGRTVYDYGDGLSSNFSRTYMSISNPASDFLYNTTEYLADVFNANWFADITPMEGLKLSARFGLNLNNKRYNDLGNAYYGQSASYGGTVYQAYYRDYGFNQQYMAEYRKTFNDVHNFDALVGYDGYDYQFNTVQASGQNLYNPDMPYVDNAIDNRIGYGSADFYQTQGIIARVNYNYNDTYFANASFRRDGSSRFSPDNRWGNFFSASAAWIMTNEDFLEDTSDWLNFLKFKASFGQQGNDAIGNYYAYLDQYKMTGADGVFSDGTLEYKGNPDLTWETSTAYNVGFDFGLFNSRLNGSVEYFGRQSSDMLYYKPVSPSLGYSELPMNVGSMRNSGFELDLNYKIIDNKDFSWSVNANITAIKNKILSLHEDLKGELIDGSSIYSEGESRYRMYMIKYAGVAQKELSEGGKVVALPGQAIYWAKNTDGKEYQTSDASLAAATNKQATDDLLPAAYGGFGTNLSFRGFDLSAQFAYQFGGQIYDSGYAMLMHNGNGGGGTNFHVDALNAWTESNTNTNVPRLNSDDKYADYFSDRFLTSSDYLSINNITIGYSLPKNLLRNIQIENLRIYVVGDNLGVLSSRKGLDPRQSYTSSSTARYTPIRTISGGVSLTF